MRWGEEDDDSDDGYGAPEGGGDDDWDAYAGLSCSSASAGPAVRAERTLTQRSSCAPPPQLPLTLVQTSTTPARGSRHARISGQVSRVSALSPTLGASQFVSAR